MSSADAPASDPVVPSVADRGPIGLVGVGNLGLPIALNLLADGTGVLGFRRDRAALTTLSSAGGQAAGSVEEVGERCGLVLLCLDTADALHTVTSRLSGAMKPGGLVVDLGTFALDDKLAARARLAEGGVSLVDAPVLGIPDMVRRRAATVLASGDDADLDRARPALASLGLVHDVGAFGDGTRLKCVANTLVALHNAAAAEALLLARLLGLSGDAVLDILGSSAAGSAMLDMRGPRMLSGTYGTTESTLDMLGKDLVTIAACAEQVASPMPLLHTAAALYERASIDHGRGQDDIASVFAVLAGSGAAD